jgi:zeaxanthin glucosyltransferase
MRIAFSAPAVPGHLNPMTALARSLQARGHEVIFIGIPDARPMIEGAGLAFMPYGQDRFPPGELARLLHRLSLLNGPEAFEFTIGLITAACRAALEDGPRVMRDSRADALVVDTIQRGFELVAMRLGLPYVHVASALHFDYSGRTPLYLYDWPYETGAEALARNRHGLEMYRKLTAPLTALQREYAEQAGLTLDWNGYLPTISKLGWLTQTPKEFDFPSDHWPKHFHYTGPLHDESGRTPVDFPWEGLTGETLIYASMGTLQNGSEGVFRNIVDGTGAPGRQIVLSIGANLDPHQIGPLPANTIVVKRAPQIELLKRANLCITHAGLNTALEALAQGVPMVAIPVTNDQPGVAARIAYTATGVVVPLKDLTAHKLRIAVDQVLADPRYRENARRLQQAIRKRNGLDVASELIERAFGKAENYNMQC